MAHIKSGVVRSPPHDVLPATRADMLMHNSPGTATGSYGTVSWSVGGPRVIVMWSAPFNFNHYSNYLAVGFIRSGRHAGAMADDMYYDYGVYNLTYTHSEYYYSTPTIRSCYEKLCVLGVMGTTHKTHVTISVYPQSYDDLASAVKRVTNSSTYNLPA